MLRNETEAVTAFGRDPITTGPCCQCRDEADSHRFMPEDLDNVCCGPVRTG